MGKDLSLKYEYLDHTADIIIKAYGNTLNEAFKNSIFGLSNICIDLNDSLNKFEKQNIKIYEETIEIKANSKEALFYDLLNEIIFLMDTKFISPIIVENNELNEIKKNNEIVYLFKSNLKCVRFNDVIIKGSVKSATYNNMKIEKKDNKFIVQTVVDL